MVERHSKNRFFHLFWLLALAGLIFLNYGRSLSWPFQFDSTALLTQDTLKNALHNFSWSHFLFQNRSVVNLLFALNYKITGLSEFWFRFINVCFHVLNSWFVYLLIVHLIQCVLKDVEKPEKNFPLRYRTAGAVFSSLIFAINPVCVYAVIYDVQRYILVATFFSLLSLLSFIRGLRFDGQGEKRSWIWYSLSVLFYFLAVHSKEHVIMLPVVMLFLVVLLRQFKKQQLIYFVLMGLVALQIVFISKGILLKVYEPHALLAVPNLEATLELQTGQFESLSRERMLALSYLNQSWLYFRYLYLWIVPDALRQTIEMALPFPVKFFSWPFVLGPFLLLIYLMTAVFLFFKRKFKGLAGFGLLFPLVLFLTEFSTVRFHESFVLYRSYLWMSGFSLLFSLMLIWLLKKSVSRLILTVFLSVYVVAMILTLYDRISPFESDLTLWQDVVDKIDTKDPTIPATFRAYGNLGSALGKAGHYDEAIAYYKKATALNPSYILPWHTLGAVIARGGNVKEAIRFLEQAILINPNNDEPYYNLGSIYSKLNDLVRAEDYLKKAIQLNPNSKDAYYNLANVTFKRGDLNGAIQYYERVLEIDQNYIDARHNLGVALAESGRHDEAISQFDILLKQNPQYATAYYNRGRSLLALKKYSEAFLAFSDSIRLRPDYVFAWHYAGVALYGQGRLEDAAEYFKQALKLDPQLKVSRDFLNLITNGQK